MSSQTFKYIFNFIVLVLVQVLLLNKIQISGFLNPYIYILFIMTLPMDIPGWLLLACGFGLGLSVDAFCDTLGMHTSATLFIAYMRPYVLQWFSPRDSMDSGLPTNAASYGLAWFIRYSAVMILLHHFWLFFIEDFTFSHIHYTLIRIILSSVLTFLLINTLQFFVQNKSVSN